MNKHTRFLIILIALMVFSAAILAIWQRPIVTFSVFANPFLNVLSGFTASLVPIAALALGLTLSLSGREYRTAYLKPSSPDAPFGAIGWLRIPTGSKWSKAGWIAAAIPAVLTVILKVYSLPGTAVFSIDFSELIATIGLVAVYALAFEILYRYSLVAIGKTAGVGDGGIMVFCVVFSGLAGYYFPLTGGVFGLLIGLIQGFLSAKAMLETGGLGWSWRIHFVQALATMIFSVATV